MDLRTWIKTLLVGAATLAMIGCGDEDGRDVHQGTEDGEVKEAVGGKGDAWNWRNDPTRFRTELVYEWEQLPQEGFAENTPWTDSYWPTYKDSINDRWQGSGTLSPAEKWDAANHGWEADDDFMALSPYNPRTCDWDQEYYDQLGPTASWVHENKGAARALRDLEQGAECGDDPGGIETWWGLCHATAPASILEDEPLEAIEHNGVRFEVSDLKALLLMEYDRTSAHMLGSRCNKVVSEADAERIGLPQIDRDETGRVTNDECRNVNAGAFHVIVTNFLGLQGRSFVEDKSFDYEVWNYPVVGYKITEQQERSLEEIQEMLDIVPEQINRYPETAEENEAVVEVANTLTADELNGADGVDLRSDRADALVENRPYASVDEIEDVYGIGPRSIERLLGYARDNGYVSGYVPADGIYEYNEDAERFVEVRIALDYLVGARSSTQPTADIIDRFIRTDHYHYILELDGEGEILGGEWAGSSITNHPDFLWLPTRANGSNPHVDLDEVRELVRQTRRDQGQDTSERLSFDSTDRVDVPDNDPSGATSTISIQEEGVLKGLKLDVDISHTYRGDLVVQLIKDDGTSMVATVYDGSDAETGWADDVQLSGEVVNGFEGMRLRGDWTLRVIDTMAQDTGSLNSWTLHADVE
jgi:subtilisin-like proprotein convertase family protein